MRCKMLAVLGIGLVLGLSGCSGGGVEADLLLESRTSIAEILETEVGGEISENPILQTWQEYLDNHVSIHLAEKVLIIDINNDGINELVCTYGDVTEFAYYHNGTIKRLRSSQNWGEGCLGGGMPFYYNQLTNEIMTRNYHSGYFKHSFYDFIEGDYILSKELIWREMRVAWEEERFSELLWLDEWLEDNDVSFEEFVDDAFGSGYHDRVYQYKIDDDEVSKEEWQDTISEFIDADGCFTLCPCNTELAYVDLKDIGEDSRTYIEKLLNIKMEVKNYGKYYCSYDVWRNYGEPPK